MKCPKCNAENPADSRFCGACATPLQESGEASFETKTLLAQRKELTRGSTFAQRYEVIEELGRGGMAEVYRVVDKKVNEEIALKFLNPDIASEKRIIERFRNELKFARKISHRNVCRMYDFSEEEGTQYITMEYVPGEDLKSSIKRMGQLSAGKAVSIAKQVCEGLAEAHRLGVTHRDLKSQNIMIDKDGNAKIMDFGIARFTKSKGITEEGVIIGTPEYMSPEQVEGKEVDHRSDIYSLGVILYEMVTGRGPFEGGTPLSIGVKQKTEASPDPREASPQTPRSLSRVILKCMEKDREKRFQSAEELLLELGKLESETPTTDIIFVKKETLGEKAGRARWRKFVLSGGIAVILILIIVVAIYVFTTRSQTINSLAVLPLKNLSGIHEEEYFVDGMTEALISNLTQLGALQRVISSTSVMQYKGARKPLPEIARELKVDTVVEGSVVRSGQRVRVTVQLIDAMSDRNLWSRSYERDMSDILALQNELARAIAQEIKIALTPAESARLTSARSVNPEAYQLYLKGRHFWKKRTEEDLMKAMKHFGEAIEKDPDYAQAYAGIADAYNMLASHGLRPPHEVYPKAKEAALKALEIDDTLAEAHTSLAWVKSWFDLDWFGAEADFNWAIGLNPSYATAHHWYGSLLKAMGRFDEAIQKVERARELDPLSLPINTELASIYRYARQYDRAIEYSKRALEIDPNFHWAHDVLGLSYVQKELYDEAVREIQKAVDLSGRSADYLGNLAYAYAAAGNRDEALRILEDLRERSKRSYVPKYQIALLYSALGEKDLALDFLERAFEEQSSLISNIKVDPWLDSLRSEPRFIALLEKMGLD